MFFRLNWEIIGFISCIVLLVSGIMDSLGNLFKLEKLDESLELIMED